MAAPPFVPENPTADVPSYRSPDHVPRSWKADRPAELPGRQPHGNQLGFQGPDQGYALLLDARLRDRLQLAPGEREEDARRGCLGLALRRASLYGRAPVIHDLTLAYRIWGFFDPNPPAELVAHRRGLFAGLGDLQHHYAEGRALVDSVPESTLRMTPSQVDDAYPARWASLVGAH